MTNKDEMTMNSDKNAYFLSLPEITELSVPPKTILLEEGKVADRMYLIRKGCLRLFFNNEGRDITFQFFFEGDFVASFDSLYQRTPSLFSLESIEPAELSVMKREDFFRNLGQKPPPPSPPSPRTISSICWDEKILLGALELGDGNSLGFVDPFAKPRPESIAVWHGSCVGSVIQLLAEAIRTLSFCALFCR